MKRKVYRSISISLDKPSSHALGCDVGLASRHRIDYRNREISYEPTSRGLLMRIPCVTSSIVIFSMYSNGDVIIVGSFKGYGTAAT